MNTKHACCASNQASAPRAPWLGAPLGVLALLFTPKCPLCFAAYLTLFGISSAAAGMALIALRSVAGAIALLSIAWLMLSWSHARASRSFAARRRAHTRAARR